MIPGIKIVVDLSSGPAELARVIYRLARGDGVAGFSCQPGVKLEFGESRLLQLLASGLKDVEIGRQLSVSERTVRYRIRRLCDRLGLSGRAELIAWAGAHGLYPNFAGPGKVFAGFGLTPVGHHGHSRGGTWER